jgi:hypothetical protein
MGGWAVGCWDQKVRVCVCGCVWGVGGIEQES